MNTTSSSSAASHREQVRDAIRTGAALTPTYVVMNLLATVIACYGLLADSTSGVIGAMVVAMLLGPIVGVGLALVDYDLPLLRRSLTAGLVGVAIVMATAWVIGSLHRDMPLGTEILARTRPGSADLAIALASGIAATIATVGTSPGLSLIGVAIATALVPPLATCSMLLARGQNELALGAFILAFTNIVAIQFAASAVLWVAGYGGGTRSWSAGYNALVRNLVSLLLLLALGAILGVSTERAVQKQLFETRVREVLQERLEGYAGAFLSSVRFDRAAGGVVVRAVVEYPGRLSAKDVAILESALPAAPGGGKVTLRLREVAVEIMTPQGPAAEGTGERAGAGEGRE
jgi:uncharacterized hydrophobic protein (TIGR00271 family)